MNTKYSQIDDCFVGSCGKVNRESDDASGRDV